MSENIDEFFDQRRHRRVAMSGDARINFGGRWHSCRMTDLSGSGGRFRSEIKPINGANVLVQLRGLGIVRGVVVHRDHASFAIEFNRADYDIDALVDNLMLPANSALMSGSKGAIGGQSEEAKRARAAKEAGEEDPCAAERDAEYQQLLEENKGRHPLRIRKLLD